MPYADFELLGGEPVELFKFVYGSQSWFWTSSEDSIDKDGDTYDPIPIVSGNISASGEAQANSVEIKVEGDNAVATLFKDGQPFLTVFVTVFRKQRNDPEFITVFSGEVSTCSFGDTEASLMCAPMQSATQRKIGTLIYQPTCNNRLYDTRCQVDRSLFSYSYRVIAANTGFGDANYQLGGNALTFFDLDKLNWLKGGTVSFGDQVLMIIEHVGDNIGTMGIFDDLVIGDPLTDTVTVFAGCDKLVATCRDKFNNLPRYQGFSYSPTVSPAKVWLPIGLPTFGNPV